MKRSIQKNSIIFKREKLIAHEALSTGLTNLMPASEFEFVEADDLVASMLVIVEKQLVRQPGNTKNENHVYLERGQCDSFLNREIRSDGNMGKTVLVVPLSWQTTGGFVICQNIFLQNIVKILPLLDDDFDLFCEDFASQISFRGDRLGDEIVGVDLKSLGSENKEFWDFCSF